MVISEITYFLLEGALEINIFVATVTVTQFSQETFSCKLGCVTDVKDEA